MYMYVSEGEVRDLRMRIKGVGRAHNYEFKFKRMDQPLLQSWTFNLHVEY